MKTAMRYYGPLIRMTEIWNPNKTKCQREREAIAISVRHWWECKVVQPLCKTVCWFLTKLTILLPDDSAISLLGIYPPKLKTRTYTKICT